MSQPALSVQIKEMEAALGVTLVERDTRRVHLTAVGEDVAARAVQILRSVEELSDLARAAAGPMSGRLRLGVIPTIAPYLLPRFLAELARELPGIDLDVRETITPNLVQELHEGALDAAILALPLSEPGLEEMPLFAEPLLLARPKSAENAPAPSARELQGLKVLMLEEGHCFRDQAMSFCELPNGGARSGLDGSSLSTLVQMVSAGIGVTILPEMAVEIEGRAAPISVTPFRGAQPTRTIGMVWRASSPLTNQFETISQIVRRSAGFQEDEKALG